MRVAAAFGGLSKYEQVKDLKNGCEVRDGGLPWGLKGEGGEQPSGTPVRVRGSSAEES